MLGSVVATLTNPSMWPALAGTAAFSALRRPVSQSAIALGMDSASPVLGSVPWSNALRAALLAKLEGEQQNHD